MGFLATLFGGLLEALAKFFLGRKAATDAVKAANNQAAAEAHSGVIRDDTAVKVEEAREANAQAIAQARVDAAGPDGLRKSAAVVDDAIAQAYAFSTDNVIETCGFVEHGTIPWVGWSPDGLVGRKHGIEAKNPLHKAYMEVKRTGKIPSEYRWQVRWGMWVGQLDVMDFLCDHPKAGLIVIPGEVTESEKQQMEERVYVLEPRVLEWMEILLDKRTAA